MGLLIDLYLYLRLMIDSCINYLFSLYYNSNRVYIPNVRNSLLLESATSLARKIKGKKIKSEDVVRAYIDRIKEINGILNAVVDNRFDEALQDARQIDDDIQSGKISIDEFNRKPFLGVPFTSKESTACKGLKWSFGLLSRKDIKSESDATIVELMKNAGGILLGVTNVPQLNLWMETFNPVYGRTSNPYDSTRNVGGSSGGEACIIAACGSPIGIGTDIGGSLRIPAYRCGVFGHKSSPDLMSTNGLTFRKGNEGPTMVVPGPITRHAEDLIPLLKVLLNNNVNKLQLDLDVDVKKLNVFYMTWNKCLLTSPLSDEVKTCLSRVLQYFSVNQEIRPKEVKFEDASYTIALWSYMMSQENSNFKLEIMNKQEEAKLSVEIIKYICRESDFCMYTILNLINGHLQKANPNWATKTIEKLKNDIIDKLGTDGILLYPSEPYSVGYHNTSILRPYNFSYYALWNVLKLPVTQVPLGLSSEGLPLGVQIVAAPHQDHLCIAAAKELEKAFGGHVSPFNVEEISCNLGVFY